MIGVEKVWTYNPNFGLSEADFDSEIQIGPSFVPSPLPQGRVDPRKLEDGQMECNI